MEKLIRCVLALILLVLWELPSHAHIYNNSDCLAKQTIEQSSQLNSIQHIESNYYQDVKENSSQPVKQVNHNCQTCSGCFAVIAANIIGFSCLFKTEIFFHTELNYSYSFLSSLFQPPRV